MSQERLTLKAGRYDLVDIPWQGDSLHGLLAAPQGRTSGFAIHVHGAWGNFYGNPFISRTADVYGKSGFAFLTANFPGHDETAIVERFDDFTPALDAWIGAFARGLPLILQGHSLGALKILHYLRDNRATYRQKVEAIVLLSPLDLVAFYGGANAEDIEKLVAEVDGLIGEAGADALAPPEVFEMWPMSLGTLRAMATPGSNADVFDTRSGLANSPLTQMTVPAFVAIGAEDFASYPSAGEVIEQVRNLQNVQAVLVQGAPHNFAERVDALAHEVEKWMHSWRGLLDE